MMMNKTTGLGTAIALCLGSGIAPRVEASGSSSSWAPAPCAAKSSPRQDPDASGPDEGESAREFLEAWPEIERKAQAEMRKQISRVRKATSEEMDASGRENLRLMGAGVVPHLLPLLGKEKGEDSLERMEAALDGLTDGSQTRLLAEYFDDRSMRIRKYCLRRCADFPDAGIIEAAMSAYGAAKARKEKLRDPDEIYYAALCAAAAGSPIGFDELHGRASNHWKDHREELRLALEGCRGPEATRDLATRLADSDRTAKIGALRMLAGCGDLDAKNLCRPFLDNTDNSLRVAAINALRGIVDGDPPVTHLPVFEAIEMAKAWKQRL